MNNNVGQRFQRFRTFQQRRLGHGRVVQTWDPFPPAQLELGLDKQMDAVRAQDANQQGSNATDQPAGVVEGVRHGQDARAERTLQQVDQRFVV